jgi:hypothetical protein
MDPAAVRAARERGVSDENLIEQLAADQANLGRLA